MTTPRLPFLPDGGAFSAVWSLSLARCYFCLGPVAGLGRSAALPAGVGAGAVTTDTSSAGPRPLLDPRPKPSFTWAFLVWPPPWVSDVAPHDVRPSECLLRPGDDLLGEVIGAKGMHWRTQLDPSTSDRVHVWLWGLRGRQCQSRRVVRLDDHLVVNRFWRCRRSVGGVHGCSLAAHLNYSPEASSPVPASGGSIRMAVSRRGAPRLPPLTSTTSLSISLPPVLVSPQTTTLVSCVREYWRARGDRLLFGWG